MSTLEKAPIVIIKAGTEFLKNFSHEKVAKMAADIAYVTRENIARVLLVSSGAVAEGRKILGLHGKLTTTEKQLAASVGQAHLIERYRLLMSDHGFSGVSQVLLTHAQLEENGAEVASLHNLARESWNRNVLPIINENDALANEEILELKNSADNDKNASLIARVFDTKRLIILTNENGILERYPDASSRIPRIGGDEITEDFITRVAKEKTSGGTWGMASKIRVAWEAARQAKLVFIGDGIRVGIREFLESPDSKDLGGGTIVHT